MFFSDSFVSLLYSLALVPRQHLPPGLDDGLKDLKGIIFSLLVGRKFKDGVNLKRLNPIKELYYALKTDLCPGIRMLLESC